MFAACGAQAGDPSPRPGMGLTPVNDELPTVSADEAARALAALQTEPTFQRVTADVEWKVAETLPDGGDIEHIDFALIVELNSPVNSDGPWKYLSCQGTRTTELGSPFRGISSLGAVFDTNGQLIRLTPLDVRETLPPVTPYPEPEPCPPGLEDEEN